MNTLFRCMSCLALPMAWLSGCANSPTAMELSLGQSVREAQSLQSVRPAPPQSERAALSTDGVVAAHGVDRYHQSYARPQPAQNVLNILTSPGSGSTALSAMPR